MNNPQVYVCAIVLLLFLQEDHIVSARRSRVSVTATESSRYLMPSTPPVTKKGILNHNIVLMKHIIIIRSHENLMVS